jgi:hypothetical protein
MRTNVAFVELRILAGLLLLLGLIGVCGGCSATGPYVEADRATFNAVAPEYEAYVSADPGLTPDQKARRSRTVQAWRLRIDAASSPSTAASAPTPAP